MMRSLGKIIDAASRQTPGSPSPLNQNETVRLLEAIRAEERRNGRRRRITMWRNSTGRLPPEMR